MCVNSSVCQQVTDWWPVQGLPCMILQQNIKFNFNFSFIVISTQMYVTHRQKGDAVPDGASCSAVKNAKKLKHCLLKLKFTNKKLTGQIQPSGV